MSAVRSPLGFTLIEVLVAVAVLGVLTLLMAPIFGALVTASANNHDEQARIDNQHIVDAMLAFARTEGGGTLPAPYTGNGYTRTIHNPSDSSTVGIAFRQLLSDTGVSMSAVNDDGTTARNVRVYQRVAGIDRTMPLYFRSGPQVTLSYDYGVIYLTACARTGSTCNPSGTGVPGASPALTASNMTSWAAVAPDVAARFVSTLPAQTAMLTATSRRVDRVRDALLSYYRGRQLTAAATDTTNWFPGSGMGGANPTGNQGCRDGWYRLDSTTLLSIVGLAAEEFGSTSWGGRIEYCRDYDPTAVKAANAPPHAAALRFNARVSQGGAPDASVLSNNVILTL